jgi:ABC-type antimicrobial peptide transport system permease subunit
MKFLGIVISAVIGIIVIFIIRFILFLILVSDICAYHNGKETGFLIDTFYEMTSSSGYHPEPNTLNQILTTIIGGVLGLTFYFYILKRRMKKDKNAI